MQRRQITMPDGRYLIFYTFADVAPAAPPADDAPIVRAVEPAPVTQTQVEAEPHV